MEAPIKFEYLKPFINPKGELIRMNSLYTIHGTQLVEAEDHQRYKPEELRELTPEELNELTTPDLEPITENSGL